MLGGRGDDRKREIGSNSPFEGEYARILSNIDVLYQGSIHGLMCTLKNGPISLAVSKPSMSPATSNFMSKRCRPSHFIRRKNSDSFTLLWWRLPGSPRLRGNAIGPRGEILLVEGDDPGAMLEALEAAPGVRDVAPFGSSFHIVVDDAARGLPAIEALLNERGLGWSRIEPIKLTLEDVFVQLVSGDGARGAAP